MKHTLAGLLALFLVFGNISFAKGLDEIIAESLQLKPSLVSIQERIKSANDSMDLSGKFSNPVVSLRMNDIRLSDPYNRSLEPMQFTAIDVTQKIPFFGKREAEKKISLAEKEIVSQSLANARLTLVQDIKIEAYRTWQLQQLFAIICDYESLTKQNIALHESYTSTTGNQHMGIMSAELTLSNLRTQKSALKSLIMESLAQLSFLGGQEIDSLELDLQIEGMPGSQSFMKLLENNLDVAVKEKEIAKEEATVNRAKLDYFPDMTLSAGYYQRNAFEDYLSVGVGVTLPLYGSEGIKIEKAKHMMMARRSEKDDLKLSIKRRFQAAYAQMQSAYEIYHIIVDHSLPQIEHMFKLTNASTSAGGDLFQYIDILKQKLALEQQKIVSVAQYNIAQAKIIQLTGEAR